MKKVLILKTFTNNELRDVEILIRGKWIPTRAIVPKEHLCSAWGCNRVTKTANRNYGKKHNGPTFCSKECHYRYERMIQRRKKKDLDDT